MKISTKGRYGLRLMVDLAINATESQVSVKEIAARQNISDKYLEQIMTTLNRAGLVKSTRGALGGYSLAAPPNEITVGAVLRALEGTLSVVSCVDNPSVCTNLENCKTAAVWERISQAVNDVVDSITLADLADEE